MEKYKRDTKKHLILIRLALLLIVKCRSLQVISTNLYVYKIS